MVVVLVVSLAATTAATKLNTNKSALEEEDDDGRCCRRCRIEFFIALLAVWWMDTLYGRMDLNKFDVYKQLIRIDCISVVSL